MRKFNGNRLKNARLYRGLTVDEVANKIDVSKQSISLYENNKSEPTFEKVRALAKELSFPHEYFLQVDKVNIKTGSTYFRSLMRTSKKYRIEQTIKMEHLASIYMFLQEYVEFPKPNLLDLVELTDPSDAAEKLRDYWELDDKPISNVIRLLEENGIIVAMFDTPTDDIDAFSQYIENPLDETTTYFIALSKNKDSAVRTNFDAAHELGHIMLHPWSEDIESLSREEFKVREKEANEFAAEFLLPKEAYFEDVFAYPASLEYYIELKKKWKVSIAAMLYRSLNLELITYNQYQYLMKTLQKKNWRKTEPLDNYLSINRPTLIRDAIELLLSNNVFSPNELLKEMSAYGLAMAAEDVELLLDLPKNTLKEVENEGGVVVNLKEIVN